MVVYIYLGLLLLIFLFLLIGLKESLVCPQRIRVLSSIILVILLFRYTALLIMFIERNIGYLYMMKPVYFLNLACMPICAAISLYIFARNNKINFLYIIFGSIILLCLYGVMIYNLPAYTNIVQDYGMGYIMKLQDSYWLIYLLYLIINLALIVFFSTLINVQLIDKKGIVIMIAAALATVIEIILPYIGIALMPQYLIGDLLWICSLDYALNKVKKE